MPSIEFKHMIYVYYRMGDPGTGKNFVIRKMAAEHDLLIAPFTKLKLDYEKFPSQGGNDYNLVFKATYRAVKATGHKHIFVDKFTSFDYKLLAYIAKQNSAKDIYLVDDHK